MTGSVKWFDSKKGYGFIVNDADDAEYFVHFSGIESEGYKTLKERDKVEFSLATDNKGEQAVNVRVI